MNNWIRSGNWQASQRIEGRLVTMGPSPDVYAFYRGWAYARYPGKTSVLLGTKAGIRWTRFGVFGKSRFGLWRFTRTYFAADVGGVLEYYPSPHTALRIDSGDSIIFYG